MSIMLDSASLDDAEAAYGLGFVRGITTNPILMRRETSHPLRHLALLLERFPEGDVYYQPAGVLDDPVAEAEQAWRTAPERVVLKLLATPAGAVTARTMVRRGARVALTAAQTASAMVVAGAIGCVAVIPYVDRAQRDPCTVTRIIAELAAVRCGDVRIVAASIKSVGQFIEALRDGADEVSAPLPVLTDLLRHPAVEDAEHDFARAYPWQS